MQFDQLRPQLKCWTEGASQVKPRQVYKDFSIYQLPAPLGIRNGEFNVVNMGKVG